ncbi:MAG: hypothetical protein IJ206_13070 [Oscillospiraceae bacterium]|nr:hypothetical protein [Oscillospiraceae bacterium]
MIQASGRLSPTRNMITDVRLGQSPISEVRLGQELIWPAPYRTIELIAAGVYNSSWAAWMPFYFTITGRAVSVDWGDGVIEPYGNITNQVLSYTYTDTTERTVTVYGHIDNIKFGRGSGSTSRTPPNYANACLLEIRSPLPIITGKQLCYGCTYLRAVSSDVLSLGSPLIDWQDAFSGCPDLAGDVSDILTPIMDGNGTWFNRMFSGCALLTGSAPAVWNKTPAPGKTLTGSSCFAGCTGLDNYTAIPSGWK